MKKHLIAVQGPLQFIAAYTACLYIREIDLANEGFELVLLVYDMFGSESAELELFSLISTLSNIDKFKNIVFINSISMNELSRTRFASAINEIKNKIGESDFDYIYLARDFLGFGSPLLMNAYSNSTKVIYGDGLGHVGYEQEYTVTPKNYGYIKYCLHTTKKFFKKMLFGEPRKLLFNEAILILPRDYSRGEYLKSIKLRTPPRSLVLSVIDRICERLPGLQRYSEDILINASQSVYLVLLSNFHASGFISTKNEVALYVELIEENVPHNSTVILKRHPRDSSDLIDSLYVELSDRYDIRRTEDKKYSRVPIELWKALLYKCTLLSIFSASAIHLKYLYDIDVMPALSEHQIRKYFFKDKIDLLMRVNENIRDEVLNLQ